MNSVGYELPSDGVHGPVDIIEIVPSELKNKAKEYCEYMKTLTSDGGNVTADNRAEDQIQKDAEAVDLLKQLQAGTDDAIAYGFMLYDEADIWRCFLAYRVGNREGKYKVTFFGIDKYLEWIQEIAAVLTGVHETHHDPLYGYKLDGVSKSGERVGYYDVMRSFKNSWNRWFLKILCQDLYKRDQKMQDNNISIEASLENEDAGHHLDAQIANSAENVKQLQPEDYATFDVVEDFLHEFLKPPLNQSVSKRVESKSYGITYNDVLKTIVDGSAGNAKAMRKDTGISQSVQTEALSKIKLRMDRFGITLEDLAKYLQGFKKVAYEILCGKTTSYKDYI